jgi:hypothetical protein
LNNSCYCEDCEWGGGDDDLIGGELCPRCMSDNILLGGIIDEWTIDPRSTWIEQMSLIDDNEIMLEAHILDVPTYYVEVMADAARDEVDRIINKLLKGGSKT